MCMKLKINLLNKIKVLKDFCTKMSKISDCTPELFLCESEEKLVFLRDILNLAWSEFQVLYFKCCT